MDWMYHKADTVDPEEYLLGRRIDKTYFKETSPVNYMRSIKDEPTSSHSQVDKSRKIHEDPLTHIKQKEYEQRKLLFKKTQIKQSDTKLMMIDAACIKEEETHSKSLEQLIIENLRQLPFNIELEKFYHHMKEKKKQKKLQKKAKNVSHKKEQKSRDLRNRSRDRLSRQNEGSKYRKTTNDRGRDTCRYRDKSSMKEKRRSRSRKR